MFYAKRFHGSTSHARAVDTPLSDVFEHFPDALVPADGEARLSCPNPAAERLLGLSLNNTRGHALDKVLILQDGETRHPVQIGDFPGQHTPFAGSFHLLVRNGGGIPVQCSVALTRSGSGTTIGWVSAARLVSKQGEKGAE